MIVTEFINFNKDVAQLPITSVLEAIQSGRCRPEVRLLRKLLTDGNDAEYKKQKRFLPAFTPSASFSGGRTLKHLQQYNALIILDIDKLNPECLEKIVAQISEISFTYACFRSPSNQGVKILVRTDAEQSLHLQTFEAVKNLYESILQVPIDPSGKDITRLCFYSWDTDLYFNPSAEVFRLSLHNCHASSPVTEALEVTKTQFPDLVEGPVSSLTQNHCHAELIEARPSNDLTPPVIEALEVTTPSVAEPLEVPDIPILTALLETRNIDITTDYNSWLNIGFALADALKEAGRDYFHRISRISPLYNAADCDKQYNNCLKSSRSGITAKTLFYIAKQHGIDISECKAPVPEAVPNTKPDPPGTDEPKKKKRSNPFDKIEKFLSANYSLRYNIVTAKLEIAPHGSSQFEPMTDYLENSIFRNLHKNNVPVSMAKLRSILQSDFCDRYDPFLDYFTKLQPCDNQTDFIQQLAETVETTDNTFWHYCFKKWIVAVVASLLDPAVVNHTAIIFSGAQGIGKTTWMENLCPRELRPYLFSGTINPNNKDTLVHLTECIFINMDELENMNRTEIGTLKEIITKSAIRIRRSYGHNNESLTRRASFMGSVNTSQFLNDTTGSRRFLCFEATSIQYKHTVNIQSVYAQAMALWQSGFQFYFDKEEVRQISDNNEKYQIRTAEEELLLTWFLPCETSLATNFYSASQILAKLSTRGCINTSTGNVISLGKALKKHGFQKLKKQGLYVYAVKELDFNQVDANSRAHPDEAPY